jgi:two-component system, NarL family, sensor kinase
MHEVPDSPGRRPRLLAHLGRGPRRVQRRSGATALVSALQALLLVAYAATVLTVTLAFASIIAPRAAPSWWAVAAALLLVGLSIVPTSRWLHHALDQLIVSWPDDPYAALSRVQAELLADPSPQAIVPAVAASITATLKLPYAAITSASDGLTVSVGTAPTGAERVSLPLSYGKTALGTLEVAARRPGARLSAGELHLLGDLARQVGITLYAAQLSDALQASRTQLVAAREEERRRIRRDLHDGLGPTLAAMRLQLGAARRTFRTEPDAADALLAELRAEIAEATAAIRSLVYDLRPPLLDEHGLVGALQSLGQLIEPQPLRLHLPERLPALPAAVEVALYRIAAEALLNVARHAHAAGCTMSLEVADEAVELRVDDTGQGLPNGHRDGVGLAAMRERAEELGGSLHVESRPGVGVSVVARLPWRFRS